MKKIFLFIAAALLSAGMWAADETLNLPDPSVTADSIIYAHSTAELVLKNCTCAVEVPFANCSGTIAWKGSADKNDRFLYIYPDGTAGSKSDDRRVVMNTSAQVIQFTASDIVTRDEKYFVVFGTTNDYKSKGTDNVVIKVGRPSYTITYNKDEYSSGDAIASDTKKFGQGLGQDEEEFTLSSSTFLREDYNQVGWALTAGGSKAYDLGAVYNGNADLNLYPYWVSASAEEHTITYANLKGQSVDSYPTSYFEGIGITFFEPLEDIEGFHFTGWSPASIGTDATTDQTITAQWKNIYAVTFDLQGHGEAIAKQDIIDGEKVTAPTEPEANDFHFGGWYKEDACENAWDFETDVVSSTTIIYAKWTAVSRPKSGVLFSITEIANVAHLVPAAAVSSNPVWVNIASDATVVGGIARAGNKDTSKERGGVNYGRIAWDSGNAVLWLRLEAPAAKGDTLRVKFPESNNGGLNIYKAYSDDNDKLTITPTAKTEVEQDVILTDAFDGLYNIYIWRTSNSTYASEISIIVPTPKTPTAIDNTSAATKAQKRIENGQLIIEKNGVRYNAQGAVVK